MILIKRTVLFLSGLIFHISCYGQCLPVDSLKSMPARVARFKSNEFLYSYDSRVSITNFVKDWGSFSKEILDDPIFSKTTCVDSAIVICFQADGYSPSQQVFVFFYSGSHLYGAMLTVARGIYIKHSSRLLPAQTFQDSLKEFLFRIPFRPRKNIDEGNLAVLHYSQSKINYFEITNLGPEVAVLTNLFRQ